MPRIFSNEVRSFIYTCSANKDGDNIHFCRTLLKLVKYDAILVFNLIRNSFLEKDNLFVCINNYISL